MTTRTELADDDGENREIRAMNLRTIDPAGARLASFDPRSQHLSVGLLATFRENSNTNPKLLV